MINVGRLIIDMINVGRLVLVYVYLELKVPVQCLRYLPSCQALHTVTLSEPRVSWEGNPTLSLLPCLSDIILASLHTHHTPLVYHLQYSVINSRVYPTYTTTSTTLCIEFQTGDSTSLWQHVACINIPLPLWGGGKWHCVQTFPASLCTLQLLQTSFLSDGTPSALPPLQLIPPSTHQAGPIPAHTVCGWVWVCVGVCQRE